jgi:hypothetical protein
MPIRRPRRAIAVDEVDQIFDEATIETLVRLAGFSPQVNRERLGKFIRDAVRNYAANIRKATPNEQNVEVAELNRAAERGDYEKVGSLLRNLSNETRDGLNARGKKIRNPNGIFRVRHHVGSVVEGVQLPSPEMLQDPARQEEACLLIAMLCRIGGGYIVGRRRPSGRNSIVWRHRLHAPLMSRHPEKCAPERALVKELRYVWFEAKGKSPSPTAHPDNLGPFARIVNGVFRLAGVPQNAAEIINSLKRRSSRNAQGR